MTQILANYTASISELKKSPSTVIEEAGDEAVAILNHNRPIAYLVPSTLYEEMIGVIEAHYISNETAEDNIGNKNSGYALSSHEESYLEDWDGCDM